MQARGIITAMVAVLLAVGVAQAAITIETVPVGNPRNDPDTRYATPGYGSVACAYNISKYEVTTGQYTAFLNAVAKTDTYGLYNPSMDTAVSSYGCNIKRTGSSGSYTYSVGVDWANRPVNYVSFWDACRFSNWMSNGQGDVSTTEYGTYTLTSAGIANNTITRNTGAMWAVASEDEWYKAAYHKNDGITGNYWDYPTGSNTLPSNDLGNPDGGNNANFYQDGYTTGSPYWSTPVGEFESSESAYGTFDQGGNMWEWNEAIISDEFRGVRGASWASLAAALPASYRGYTESFSSTNGPRLFLAVDSGLTGCRQ